MQAVLCQIKRTRLFQFIGAIFVFPLLVVILVASDETMAAPPVLSMAVTVADEIAEPGGALTYTVEITNNFPLSNIVLTALTDSYYGDLTDGSQPELVSSDCLLGPIAPGQTYACTFIALFEGDVGTPDRETLVTATGEAAGSVAGSATAETRITIIDAAPSISVRKTAVDTILEPGGIVEYRVRVRNDSVSTDLVQLTRLEDELYGDLTDIANPLLIETSCTLSVIEPDSISVCRFSTLILGNAGDSVTSVVAAEAQDNEGTLTPNAQYEHTLTIEDRLPDISISNAALPSAIPETGASVGFRIRITNNSPEEATLTSLTDSVFGDLDGVGDCVADGSIALLGDTPLTPAGGNEYICTFTRLISGDFGGSNHMSTATVTVVDDEENVESKSDDASVVFTDSLPAILVEQTADPAQVPEAGADVAFTIKITNETAEEIAVDSLTDSVYGDLRQQGECAADSDTLIGGNESYTCTFTRVVSGEYGAEPHQNTISVATSDDEGNLAEGEATAIVAFLDTLPQASLTKDANPTSVPETGGTVTFTISIANETAEDLIIYSLDDDKFGDLNGVGNCVADGTVIVPGNGSYTCRFLKNIAGSGGTNHVNIVSMLATDDEENEVVANDSATVEIVDSPSIIRLAVTADPTTVLEFGEVVLYNVSVENGSPSDSMLLSALTEGIWGDLTQTSESIVSTTCQMPQTLPTNETKQSVYECEFSAKLVGNAGDTLVSELTVGGTDDDGGTVTDRASASIRFRNAAAPLTLSIVADPKSIPDGGADVEFSVSIQNDSPIDSVNLTALSDSILGDLTKTALTSVLTTDCALPQKVGAGLAYTCKFTAAIPGAETGAYTSTVSVAGTDDDNSPASGKGELKVAVAQPLLVLTKTDLLFVDADRNFVVSPGDTLFYRLSVRNEGNAAAVGVVVEDELDPSTTLMPDTIVTDLGTADVDESGQIQVAIGTLQANQEVTVSFQVLFAPEQEIEQIENQAIVKFDDPLPGSTRRISVESDDPDTKDASDKTRTPVMYDVKASGIIFLPVVRS